MKLQKRFLRKYHNKDYFKFIINLPPKIIEKAQLKEGDNLEIFVEEEIIKIKKISK
jgi:bifunctional DNA-binding transcriptional regulator/antitoxin component of YhaV-PrlF toxin-antitoxin module